MRTSVTFGTIAIEIQVILERRIHPLPVKCLVSSYLHLCLNVNVFPGIIINLDDTFGLVLHSEDSAKENYVSDRQYIGYEQIVYENYQNRFRRFDRFCINITTFIHV